VLAAQSEHLGPAEGYIELAARHGAVAVNLLSAMGQYCSPCAEPRIRQGADSSEGHSRIDVYVQTSVLHPWVLILEWRRRHNKQGAALNVWSTPVLQFALRNISGGQLRGLSAAIILCNFKYASFTEGLKIMAIHILLSVKFD
jgi:hypothetical protein